MFVQSFFRALFLVLFAVSLLPGCTGMPKKPRRGETPQTESGMPIPRADPGYLHYLERQSLLAQAGNMAKIVSGSDLAWRTPNDHTPGKLMDFADTWLAIHPLTLLSDSRRPAFVSLNEYAMWPILRESGIKGLYIAPANKAGSLWAYNRNSTVNTGEDVVQFDFSDAAGSEAHYKRFMNELIGHDILLGSDIIPAATGLGPDFFLATRNHREYPGVYCLIDLPRATWKNLPTPLSEWEGLTLDKSHVQSLQQQGVLPPTAYSEESLLSQPGAWAVTGEIRGIDGTTRRWAYRSSKHPAFAVLNWEDPSQAAHRILSGSAVRQVGMLGQALVGLNFGGFQGLETATPQTQGLSQYSIEPALSAAHSMSREIRRYSGWSWIRNEDLPLIAVNEFLDAGVDYVLDSAFNPAAEHALLTGDAELLRFMTDELLRLRVDTSRLVHATPAQDGISYDLAHLRILASQGNAAAQTLYNDTLAAMNTAATTQTPLAAVKGNRLYTTGAGLAAMALGIQAHDVPAEAIAEVTRGHTLLLLFKALQPGIFMPSGQDLAGVLPLAPSSMTPQPEDFFIPDTSRGTYALTGTGSMLMASSLGMPRAKTIYPPASAQAQREGSFLREIGEFIAQRTKAGIAKGILVARPYTQGKGSIALLIKLPETGQYLLSVCNFGTSSVTETLNLKDVPEAAAALGSLASVAGSNAGASVSGHSVTVNLKGWQGVGLLLGKKKTPGTTKERTTDTAGEKGEQKDAPKEPAKEPKKEEAKTS